MLFLLLSSLSWPLSTFLYPAVTRVEMTPGSGPSGKAGQLLGPPAGPFIASALRKVRRVVYFPQGMVLTGSFALEKSPG